MLNHSNPVFTLWAKPLRVLSNWTPAVAVPTPAPGEVHVWKFELDTEPHHIAQHACTLSEREQLRADRLKFDLVRRRYIKAHSQLRNILAKYVECDPRAIVFAYGPRGKPSVASTQASLQFNLTHSADLALLAVATDTPLGVDSELIRERKQVRAIAKRMFEPWEYQHLVALPQTSQLVWFYQCWTRFEARIKAEGGGIFHGYSGDYKADTACVNFVPHPGFVAALAAPSLLPPIAEWKTFQPGNGR